MFALLWQLLPRAASPNYLLVSAMTDFMQRIAKPQADPRDIPEHHLWTLTKDGRRAEARTRMVPIGAGRPELRFLRLKWGDGRVAVALVSGIERWSRGW